MKNTNTKDLINVNENSIFYRIKMFFIKMFNKDKNNHEFVQYDNETNILESKREEFLKDISVKDNEELLLLRLQQKFRNGEISESDLTEQQKKDLCDLYDKQIAKLRKSNELRKQRIKKLMSLGT